MRSSTEGSPSHEAQRSRPAKRKWSAPCLTQLGCASHTDGGFLSRVEFAAYKAS